MPIHLSGNGSSHSELMSARDCLIRVKVPIILFPGALMVTSLHDSDKEENMRLSDDGHTMANACHEKFTPYQGSKNSKKSFGLQTFVKSVLLLELKL